MIRKKSKNTSYGVIAYKIIDNIANYCLVCRKDSFTYSEFIRGKYELEDVECILRIFRYMTESEKLKILNSSFETLWDSLWVLDRSKIYSGGFKKELTHSKYKFDTLKKGYHTTYYLDKQEKCKKYVKLLDILKEVREKYGEIYTEPEWGFPKGKKNENETNYDCALREFTEETNIPKNVLEVKNTTPIIETFIADNLQEYTHIYYLAEVSSNLEVSFNSDNFYQLSEISKIGWYSYEEVISKIRKYNVEKVKVIGHIHQNVLKNTSESQNVLKNTPESQNVLKNTPESQNVLKNTLESQNIT